jgi:hypothetical protein
VGTSNYDPFDTEGARPFKESCKYIKEERPAVVIKEMVRGAKVGLCTTTQAQLHPSCPRLPSEASAYDYMVYGVGVQGDWVGLALIPGFLFRSLELPSGQYGSPQWRVRVYTILVRADVGSESDMDALCHLLLEVLPTFFTRCRRAQFCIHTTATTFTSLEKHILLYIRIIYIYIYYNIYIYIYIYINKCRK